MPIRSMTTDPRNVCRRGECCRRGSTAPIASGRQLAVGLDRLRQSVRVNTRRRLPSRTAPHASTPRGSTAPSRTCSAPFERSGKGENPYKVPAGSAGRHAEPVASSVNEPEMQEAAGERFQALKERAAGSASKVNASTTRGWHTARSCFATCHRRVRETIARVAI
jgi:hypothetical protein